MEGKLTKEEALKRIGELENAIARWDKDDRFNRDTLTQIICGYSPVGTSGGYSYSQAAKAQTMNWLELSAEIGKLLNIKSIQSRDAYIRELEAENYKLKNPTQ